jgi:hypothetical protein
MNQISFWRFPQKVNILEYMLLHKINKYMVIANILHHQKVSKTIRDQIHNFWYLVKQHMGAATFHGF